MIFQSKNFFLISIDADGQSNFHLSCRPHLLPRNQLRKEPLLFHQLFIRPIFYDLSPIQNQDPVAMTDRGQTVSNDDSCTFHLVEGIGNLLLCDVVERGGCLIEQEEPWLWRNGPGDHEPLPLTAGDSTAAFLKYSVHSHRHGADIVRDARCFCCFPGLFHRERRGGYGYIFVDTAAEQFPVLHDRADQPPDRPHIQMPCVLPVIEDGAFGGFLEAKQKSHKRRLSATRAANDGKVLSGRNGQVEVVNDSRPV